MLKLANGAVVLYCGIVALLYVAQRRLQYFPERRRTVPRAVGLPEAEEAVVDTADGERVIVWHVPPREGQLVFLYFHGNGGSLRWRDERFRALIADGSGLVALSYRGYGGSSGRPTETGLLADAAAAYAFTIARYAAERIVLWGESLGSALAVALAAEKPVGNLVLEAPYTDCGPLHLGGSSPAGLRLSCAHAALVSRPVDLPQRQSESVCPASATQTLRSAPSCCFTTRTSLPAGSWMQPAGKPFRFSSIDIL
jgi:pimeloyl-ACP methyl ester carboxylesterase